MMPPSDCDDVLRKVVEEHAETRRAVIEQDRRCASCQATVSGQVERVSEQVAEIHQVVYVNGLVSDIRSIQLAVKVVAWLFAVVIVPTCLAVAAHFLGHLRSGT